MKYFIFILVFLSSLSVQAAEVQRRHATGNFALDLDGASTKGVVQPVEGGDVETTSQTIMLETAKDSKDDLRDTLGEMKRTNQEKAALREYIRKKKASGLGARKSGITGCPKPPCDRALSAQDLRAEKEEMDKEIDKLSAQSTEISMKLQKAMDRRKKIMETLSNMLKKSSETSGSITGNMK